MPEQEAAGQPVEPYDKVADEMRRRASERAFDDQVARWMKELRQKARIGIYRIPPQLPAGRTPVVVSTAPPAVRDARALSVLAAILAALRRRNGARGAAGRGPARASRCPMRDGVKLSADVLRPKAEGRFPTLVYRTPYDRKRASEDEVGRRPRSRPATPSSGSTCAGRYGSAGVFTPYRNEGARRIRHHRVGRRAALVDGGRSAPTASRIRAPCSGSRPSSRRRT